MRTLDPMGQQAADGHAIGQEFLTYENSCNSQAGEHSA